LLFMELVQLLNVGAKLSRWQKGPAPRLIDD
jgi:hypothetical protein